MAAEEINAKKLAVLAVIKQKKNILFGSDDLVSEESKIRAWQSVLLMAQAEQLADEDKSWQYARDELFNTWKNRTLAKTIAERNFGANYDSVDSMIMEILDPGPYADLYRSSSTESLDGDWEPHFANESLNFNFHQDSPVSRAHLLQLTAILRRKRVDILSIDSYYRRVKLFRLERELGLQASLFTKTLPLI